jgi:hypothetical protein
MMVSIYLNGLAMCRPVIVDRAAIDTNEPAGSPWVRILISGCEPNDSRERGPPVRWWRGSVIGFARTHPDMESRVY